MWMPISYEFTEDEFTGEVAVEAVCKELEEADAGFHFGGDHSLEKLNNILSQPDFYERWHSKGKDLSAVKEIDALIKKTGHLRNKPFAELSTAEAQEIKHLNRLVIEHVLPKACPPIRKRFPWLYKALRAAVLCINNPLCLIPLFVFTVIALYAPYHYSKMTSMEKEAIAFNYRLLKKKATNYKLFESYVIGILRYGIDSYKRGTGQYPAELDAASIGKATVNNPLFTKILNTPITEDWEKTGDLTYRSPADIDYRYDPDSGKLDTLSPR